MRVEYHAFVGEKEIGYLCECHMIDVVRADGPEVTAVHFPTGGFATRRCTSKNCSERAGFRVTLLDYDDIPTQYLCDEHFTSFIIKYDRAFVATLRLRNLDNV